MGNINKELERKGKAAIATAELGHFNINITKCLTVAVRTKLFTQLDRLVIGLRSSYVRHLRGTIEAGASPGMNKYRTTAGG